MAKYTIEDTTLSAIADAIRSKEGSSELIAVLEMAQRILDIQTGIDTSDATATEADVLNGQTFYANGVKKTGVMAHHTVDDHNVVWTLANVPTGSGAAKMVVQLPEGFYDGASYGVGTLNMHQPQSTITPDVSDVSLPGGAWYMNGVTIKGDANLVAANIKSGVSIFGKSGTFTSDATAKASEILKDKTAYVNGSMVTGTMKSIAAATITPGTQSQYIDPGVYISGTQTIKGDASLKAANIKKGVSIFGVTGTLAGEPSLITFKCYINSELYLNCVAPSGMTWQEYASSKYNTLQITIEDGVVWTGYYFYTVCNSSGTRISPTAAIVSGHIYKAGN